jgi:hypothetical protein
MFFEKLSKAKLVKDGDDDLPSSEGAMSDLSGRSANEEFKGFNFPVLEEQKEPIPRRTAAIRPGRTQ